MKKNEKYEISLIVGGLELGCSRKRCMFGGMHFIVIILNSIQSIFSEIPS